MQRYKSIQAPVNICDFDLVIDVRSPSEFTEDHAPGAINMPVLDDKQRQEVGTLYKENAFQASRVGASLICSNIANMLSTQLKDQQSSSKILAYCWRGNQRSQSLAHVLQSVGWDVTLLKGGYKGYRKTVIDSIETFFTTPELKLRVISGFTGTGKTHLLSALADQGKQVIDLEALANHKGSLFGRAPDSPQPSQKHFENQLSQTISKLNLAKPIYIESESSRIGDIFCPAPLWKAMKAAEVVEIEMPIDHRVQIVLHDYDHLLKDPDMVASLLARLESHRGKETVALWQGFLKEQDWLQLINGLLSQHYDLAYKPAGSRFSAFCEPVQTFFLNDCSQKEFSRVASDL